MDQPAQDIVPENPGGRTRALDVPSARRRFELKSLLRLLLCVMAGVGPEHPLEMPTTVDQDMVQALSPYGPHEPLGERAFARGARIGARMLRTPSVRNTSSNRREK
jgi:hypothetical protein